MLKVIKTGNVESVETLLDNGVVYDFKDKDGNNALYIAAQKGNVKIVKMLLAKPWIFLNYKDKERMNRYQKYSRKVYRYIRKHFKDVLK